jgi:hypothetical protein
LGAILGDGVERFPRRVAVEAPETPVAAVAKKHAVEKRRIAFDVSVELAEKVRDCVMHLSGPPLHLNLSRFAESALLSEIERLRDAHNGGEEFPRRAEDPRPGRPLA